MGIKDPVHIVISKLDKEKLDVFKLIEKESYNSVINELIKFGEENDFKSIRIKNLNKKLEVKENDNAKIKIEQEPIRTATIQ